MDAFNLLATLVLDLLPTSQQLLKIHPQATVFFGMVPISDSVLKPLLDSFLLLLEFILEMLQIQPLRVILLLLILHLDLVQLGYLVQRLLQLIVLELQHLIVLDLEFFGFAGTVEFIEFIALFKIL